MSSCPISAGQIFTFSKVITEEVYQAFLVCSGDVNPLHFDDAYAQSLGHPGKLMHGALLNAMISGLVGTGLPTKDTMCLMQKVNFKRPFFLNDEIVLTATVFNVQDAPVSGKWLIEMSLKFKKGTITVGAGSVEVMIGAQSNVNDVCMTK